MALAQPERGVAVSAAKFLVKAMISVILCVGSVFSARAQDAQPNNTNESWTATTQSSGDNANPSRTTDSHTKSGNRSVDKQTVEILGPEGRYQPISDTEKETTQVDARTTRTVVRRYRWDASEQRRYLVAVTEEEARTSTSGDAEVVRTTSNSDLNGNLRVVEREVANTRKTSPDAQETTTMVYTTDGTGGLTPSLQTQELQKRSADHRVEVKETTLLPDGNGNWVVGTVKETTTKEDGKNRISQEGVLSPDSGGRLSAVSHTVGEETATAAGEKIKTVETYSMDIPGVATDGHLHLNLRVTTVQKKDSDGETTEQQVEQPNPENPTGSRQVGAKTKYTVQYAASGTQQTKTIERRDINSAFNVVSTETRSTDQVPPAQVPVAPSDRPK